MIQASMGKMRTMLTLSSPWSDLGKLHPWSPSLSAASSIHLLTSPSPSLGRTIGLALPMVVSYPSQRPKEKTWASSKSRQWPRLKPRARPKPKPRPRLQLHLQHSGLSQEPGTQARHLYTWQERRCWSQPQQHYSTRLRITRKPIGSRARIWS